MATTTSNVEIDFDFSQLDETAINEQQKQNIIDYINQIQTQKRALHDELNSFKTSTGSSEKETKRVFSLRMMIQFLPVFISFSFGFRNVEKIHERTNEQISIIFFVEKQKINFFCFVSLLIFVLIFCLNVESIFVVQNLSQSVQTDRR